MDEALRAVTKSENIIFTNILQGYIRGEISLPIASDLLIGRTCGRQHRSDKHRNRDRKSII